MHNLNIISPEISLVSLAIFSALFALFTKHKMAVLKITASLLIALIFVIFNCTSCLSGSTFNGSFTNNVYTLILKGSILISSALIIISYIGHIKNIAKEIQTEFVALFLLSIAGSFVAISARDLLVLFLGLELQSLPAYILAAFATSNLKSSEAGLKYFILGALSSAILLFGASFIYGSVGSVDYADISNSLARDHNIALIVGISLVLISIMFKLSIAPFHMWTPDVYEGAPIMSVTIFSSVHKMAALAVFVNLISLAIGKFAYDFLSILKVFAILSLIVGALGAIFQTSIKRLMAYSAILNVGYMLLAIIVSISLGVWRHSFFTYMIIYAVSVIALFAILAATFGEKADDVKMNDLAGLGKTKKVAAWCISVVMFSMIGIPPLAGFFGKYYVLLDLVSIEEYTLVVVAIIASLIAAYYYLKVIKSIYFDEPTTPAVKIRLSMELILVVASCIAFLLCFIFGIAEYFSDLKLVP